MQTSQDLAAFIGAHLQTHKLCRVYQEALDAAWSQPDADPFTGQSDLIHRFAKDHGWTVEIHDPGAFGKVADFQRVASPALGMAALRS